MHLSRPDLDWLHVVLAVLLVVVILTKLRTAHRRRFGLTLTIERQSLDTAETEQKHEPTSGPHGGDRPDIQRGILAPADDDHHHRADDHDDHYRADDHDHRGDDHDDSARQRRGVDDDDQLDHDDQQLDHDNDRGADDHDNRAGQHHHRRLYDDINRRFYDDDRRRPDDRAGHDDDDEPGHDDDDHDGPDPDATAARDPLTGGPS